MVRVQVIQLRAKTWKASETQYSVMAEVARKAMLGCNISRRDSLSRESVSHRYLALVLSGHHSPVDTEDEFSLVDEYTTDIRDQGRCGSCVAFGAIAAVETTYLFQSKQAGLDFDLSEADLFFCSGKEAAACGTGWQIKPALEAMQYKGVVTEDEFPYDFTNENCQVGRRANRDISISGYRLLSSISEMEDWIKNRGALVTSFNVYEDFFFYSEGIYKHVYGGLLNGHCVAVVGFNSAEQYWICKNSWGASWGEGGYFKIAYGQCGIEADMWGIDEVEVGGSQLAKEFSRVSRDRFPSGIRSGKGMSSSTASAQAGLRTYLNFYTERALQDYCLEVLQSKGLNPEQEVWVGEGLRADILCRSISTVYELKKTLTREAIYQALGQGKSYMHESGMRSLVIVGQLPSSGQDEARAVARNIERQGNVRVSFIEEDSFWEIDQGRRHRAQIDFTRLLLLALGVCMVAYGGKSMIDALLSVLFSLSLEGLLKLILSALFFTVFMGFGCFRGM